MNINKTIVSVHNQVNNFMRLQWDNKKRRRENK